MATSICSKVSSCWVLRSTKAGQVGLHCGHWQVSTRWKGHPLAGVRLLRVASRLRSQQYRARDREMPRTWKLSQLLKEEMGDIKDSKEMGVNPPSPPWKVWNGVYKVSPSWGSNTGIYLLVMTVWDRQDGANTALQPRIEEQRLTFYLSLFFHPSSTRSCDLTWHPATSSWSLCRGSECTATVPQTGSARPCRCSQLSAAPHQTATAQ